MAWYCHHHVSSIGFHPDMVFVFRQRSCIFISSGQNTLLYPLHDLRQTANRNFHHFVNNRSLLITFPRRSYFSKQLDLSWVTNSLLAAHVNAFLVQPVLPTCDGISLVSFWVKVPGLLKWSENTGSLKDEFDFYHFGRFHTIITIFF